MYKITECRLLGKSDEEMVNEILVPYIIERQEQSTVSLCMYYAIFNIGTFCWKVPKAGLI